MAPPPDAYALAYALDVTPQQAAMLRLLLLRPYVAGADFDVNNVCTAINRLRNRVKPKKIGIVVRRGFGYELTPESKAHIAELVAAARVTMGGV